MSQIQIEAHIQTHSDAKASVGLCIGLSAGIVVPKSEGFGPARQAKPTLKIASMDVTSPKEGA